MTLAEYRLTHYTEASRPSVRTLQRWVQNGILPGKKQGKLYFVDIRKVEKLSGHALVDKVLLAYK